VGINALPVLTLYGGGVCPGYSFTLAPAGAASYTSSAGSLIVTPSVTTTYSVTGTSIDGCVSPVPAVATVSVVNILTVTISGTNTLCLGDTLNLMAGGASQYIWNTGGTTPSYTATPTSGATYTVIGSSGNCSDTAIVAVAVNPLTVV
jgi:hypothetical protein